jgi:hypothetical protein
LGGEQTQNVAPESVIAAALDLCSGYRKFGQNLSGGLEVAPSRYQPF